MSLIDTSGLSGHFQSVSRLTGQVNDPATPGERRLAAANRSLSRENTQLESANRQLESQNSRLESRNRSLKEDVDKLESEVSQLDRELQSTQRTASSEAPSRTDRAEDRSAAVAQPPEAPTPMSSRASTAAGTTAREPQSPGGTINLFA
ncbi:MAG: hypothetical protein ACQETD_11910 [Pseudomonadota bacterium]